MRWLLFLLLVLPGWAKTPDILPPDVVLTGIVRKGQTSFAVVVVSGERSYTARQGQVLGDYEVRSITANTVTFAYKDRKFPFWIREPVPAGRGFCFTLQDCSLISALKLVARSTGRHFLAAEGVTGDINLTATGLSLGGVLARLLKGQPLAWRLRDNTLFAGPAALLDRAPVRLHGIDVLTGPLVSYNLEGADLTKLLDGLAQKMKLKFTYGRELKWSSPVTVTAQNVPAGWLLAQVLAMQRDVYRCTVSKGVMLVEP